MKKVFISCPMKGRTTENIKKTMDKMHKCAEAALGEELEMIQSIVADTPPSGINERIWYLGESIKFLSEADLLVTLDTYPYGFSTSGCDIEKHVAREYGIKKFYISGDCFEYFCPDLVEKLKAESEAALVQSGILVV